MLVAFRFHITNPETEIPTKFLAIDVLVEPRRDFYLFLIGTIMSLLTTHAVLHYHRFSDTSIRVDKGGPKISLANHVFDGPSYGMAKEKKVKCSIFGKLIVTFMLLLGFAVIIWGSFVESFKFEFKGLAGQFLGDQASAGYSLISIIEAVPQAAEDPSAFGIRWMQSVFYMVSFLIPVVHMVVMLILFWVPMTARFQYAVFFFSEILFAWSALDVFVVSILAAILQIQQFAHFLVGDKCDAINGFIEQYLTGYLGGYNTCFTVIATLSDGCWILFFASLISFAVSQIVMRTCHKAMYGRLHRVASRAASRAISRVNSKRNLSLSDSKGEDKVIPYAKPSEEKEGGCLSAGELFVKCGLLVSVDKELEIGLLN
eukprot:CAMPEP_0197522608 /NCGR_PEP_ID=MMETSP1318-20131121/7720_1 /TAXON_ID=552666 /ORGANISM="Partenskyella glossopodia, Strain RCC365" /LENGTH=371 /DNA_ID=CAMNT_0043075029 /DNA_START=1 /DNA_END=1116 /DNA_ORIENTATION=-